MSIVINLSFAYFPNVATSVTLLTCSRSHFGALSPRIMEAVRAGSSMVDLITQSDTFQFTRTVALFGESITLELLENKILSKIRFLRDLELSCSGIRGEKAASRLADILLQRFQHSLRHIEVEVYFSVMSFFVPVDHILPRKLLRYHRQEQVRICAAKMLSAEYLNNVLEMVFVEGANFDVNEEPNNNNNGDDGSSEKMMSTKAIIEEIFDSAMDALMEKEVSSVASAVTLVRCLSLCFCISLTAMSSREIPNDVFHQALLSSSLLAENNHISSQNTKLTEVVSRMRSFIEAMNFVLVGNSQGLLKTTSAENDEDGTLENFRASVMKECGPILFYGKTNPDYISKFCLLLENELMIMNKTRTKGKEKGKGKVSSDFHDDDDGSLLLSHLVKEINRNVFSSAVPFVREFPVASTKAVTNLINASIQNKTFILASFVLMETDFFNRLRFHTKQSSSAATTTSSLSRRNYHQKAAKEIFDRVLLPVLNSTDTIAEIIISHHHHHHHFSSSSIGNSARLFASRVKDGVFPIFFHDLMGIRENVDGASSNEKEDDFQEETSSSSIPSLALRDSILRLICNNLLNFSSSSSSVTSSENAIKMEIQKEFENAFLSSSSSSSSECLSRRRPHDNFSFQDQFLSMVSEFCVLDPKFSNETLAALLRASYRFHQHQHQQQQQQTEEKLIMLMKVNKIFMNHLNEALTHFGDDKILLELKKIVVVV